MTKKRPSYTERAHGEQLAHVQVTTTHGQINIRYLLYCQLSNNLLLADKADSILNSVSKHLYGRARARVCVCVSSQTDEL